MWALLSVTDRRRSFHAASVRETTLWCFGRFPTLTRYARTGRGAAAAGHFLRAEPLPPRPPRPRGAGALGGWRGASEPQPAPAAERSGPPRRQAAPRLGRPARPPAAPLRGPSKPDGRRRSGQSGRGSDSRRRRPAFVELPEGPAARRAPAEPRFPPRAPAGPEGAASRRRTKRRDSSTCGRGTASLRGGTRKRPGPGPGPVREAPGGPQLPGVAGRVVPEGGSAEEAARALPSAGLRFPGSRARRQAGGAGLSAPGRFPPSAAAWPAPGPGPGSGSGGDCPWCAERGRLGVALPRLPARHRAGGAAAAGGRSRPPRRSFVRDASGWAVRCAALEAPGPRRREGRTLRGTGLRARASCRVRPSRHGRALTKQPRRKDLRLPVTVDEVPLLKKKRKKRQRTHSLPRFGTRCAVKAET